MKRERSWVDSLLAWSLWIFAGGSIGLVLGVYAAEIARSGAIEVTESLTPEEVLFGIPLVGALVGVCVVLVAGSASGLADSIAASRRTRRLLMPVCRLIARLCLVIVALTLGVVVITLAPRFFWNRGMEYDATRRALVTIHVAALVISAGVGIGFSVSPIAEWYARLMHRPSKKKRATALPICPECGFGLETEGDGCPECGPRAENDLARRG